ncbi:MAG: hypothetical protein EOP56_03865 [Sphingobacteriales bacterium]|nr:MAG: hypothetical protein EOP56_03865 [Sphingobacteriales bacterium]
MNNPAKKYQYAYSIAAAAIILLGIALRLKVLADSRCLWIDEASVARNIYERGFIGLTTPLDYYQYAPPLYLWIVKLSAILFGYCEAALRLWPFIAGVGSLYFLWRILKRETSAAVALYPLSLMATGFMYVRYGTELKQYIPDMFIATLLVYLALVVDVLKAQRGRFFFIWLVAGSLSIWASMPSVFILAGIGLYYLVQVSKDVRKAGIVVVIAVLWILQFALYYFIILKPQIHSGYLQNYHQNFFLFALPGSLAEWGHNKDVLLSILKVAVGDKWYTIYFNLILLAVGVVSLLRNHRAKSVLFILPLVCMIAAAAMNQYSLIPRLTLVIMPLLYVSMAYGFVRLLSNKTLRFLAVSIAILCVFGYQRLDLFTQPFEQEEITRGLDYLNKKGVAGNDLYVVVGAEHAYLYYTEMHPDKDKWHAIRHAHLLSGGIDYDSLATNIQGKPAFLYTIVFDSFEGKKKLDNHIQLTDSFATEGCYVFIYCKPD